MRTQSARSHAASSARKRRTASAASNARPARGPERSKAAAEAETPRAGAKRTIVSTMKELPNFLRLLGGLMTDRRVSNTDKLLVGGAITYILMPMDFIPDYIPFLGEI
ncbi:MAG TPA: YkvA family protein, partial [Gemmatimonadaceae bacterium]|nr:YkvA family protein [Gemmatimonadaceae bacterium]